jgi:hypothetical protein
MLLLMLVGCCSGCPLPPLLLLMPPILPGLRVERQHGVFQQSQCWLGGIRASTCR